MRWQHADALDHCHNNSSRHKTLDEANAIARSISEAGPPLPSVNNSRDSFPRSDDGNSGRRRRFRLLGFCVATLATSHRLETL
jgi:hypothetical protein